MAKLFIRLHVFFYRLLGGRLVGRISGLPVLLLTTVGRKSGKRRTTPLMYVEDGGDMIVVGSNGGRDQPPAWWSNLKASGSGAVQTGSKVRRVQASLVEVADRERLLSRFTASYAGYAKYQAKTARQIPLVRLHPEAN